MLAAVHVLAGWACPSRGADRCRYPRGYARAELLRKLWISVGSQWGARVARASRRASRRPDPTLHRYATLFMFLDTQAAIWLCVYTRICVCARICVYARTCVHAYMRVYAYIRVYRYMPVYAYMRVYAYIARICAYMRRYGYMRTCVYMHIYACMRICPYMRIYV